MTKEEFEARFKGRTIVDFTVSYIETVGDQHWGNDPVFVLDDGSSWYTTGEDFQASISEKTK